MVLLMCCFLTEYMNNPIFQELPSEDDYFDVTRDDRIYLDLRASSGYVKEAEKLERNIQVQIFT